MAEARKVGLEKLSLEELQTLNAGITADVFSVLSVQNSVKSRTSFGGTAPAQVRRQVRAWRKRLARA
jgi:argininosuccinate lyase